VNSAGSDFLLVSPYKTMIKSKRPTISVCAIRTGCGKSQTTRKICSILRKMGIKAVVIRHPMPYGDLKKQIVQKFAKEEDMERYNCTIEEREEYEQHIKNGFTVFAGVDYEKVLKAAEKEADVIIWDGGNNDTPFIKPDLHIVVADPFRPEHAIKYYPSETNVAMADVIVINKENTAKKREINKTVAVVKKINKKAILIHADSVIEAEEPSLIKGKKVLVIEDGPTLTHGEMSFGAGFIAAKKYKAKAIVQPKKYACGSIRKLYEKYPHLRNVLPAMGYSKEQIKDMEKTINRSPCDTVVVATPADITKLMNIRKPVVRVSYHLKEKGAPNLEDVVKSFLRRMKI